MSENIIYSSSLNNDQQKRLTSLVNKEESHTLDLENLRKFSGDIGNSKNGSESMDIFQKDSSLKPESILISEDGNSVSIDSSEQEKNSDIFDEIENSDINVDILQKHPSLIQKNIKEIENSEIKHLMKEDEEFKTKIIKEIIAGLNNGIISYENIETDIKDENLKSEIKINFIDNEMNHLKVKFEIKKITENNNFINIKKGINMSIDEMHKIKNYKYCRLHKDFISIYNELSDKYIINKDKEEKQIMDSFLKEVMLKISKLKSDRKFKGLFNKNVDDEENMKLENKINNKGNLTSIISNNENGINDRNFKYEEFLFSIPDTNARLKIEEDILKCNEEQMNIIYQLEKQVEELDSQFSSNSAYISSDKLKNKMNELIIRCIDQMKINSNNNFQSENNIILGKIYQKYSEKSKQFNVLSDNIPKFREKYSYKLCKTMQTGDTANTLINQRYEKFKTIFHNEALTNDDKDYIEVMVSLIRVGANVSLKDSLGYTPINYIKSNKIDEFYDYLKHISIRKNYESLVDLRIIRSILEFEAVSTDNKENLEKYFESLYRFVKRSKDIKSNEDLENILSIHVWHEENTFIRKEKEKYFLKMKKNLEMEIEDAQKFFKENGFNEMGMTIDNKKLSNLSNEKSMKYYDYIKKINENMNDIQIINNYLLENSFVKFNIERNRIINEIEILNSNKFSEEVNSIMEDNIENFLLEYPSQVEMSLSNNIDILEEIIDHNNLRLIKSLVKNGRNLNYPMKNGKLPLEKAIENNNSTFVKELINLKLNLEIRASNGKKIIELIKEKMPDLYRTEMIVDENDTIDEILNTKDEKIIKIMVKEKILNIDKEDDNGINSLEYAIMNRDVEKTKKLIRLRANYRNLDGLIQFMLKNDLENDTYGLKMNEFMSQLRSEGKKMNEIEIRNYYSVAREYAINGDFNKVKIIIKYCKDIFKWQNEGELNLLSKMVIMSENNNLDVLINIIKDDPEIINNMEIAVNCVDETTPMHYIVKKIKQNHEAIKILKDILPIITNVKILDKKNKNGITALDYAVSINDMETIKLLYDKNMELRRNNNEKIENIIHMQYSLLNENITAEILKDMINEVINIRKENEDIIPTFSNVINDNNISSKQSLLHIASYLGKMDIINFLLEQKDININVVDVNGRTPIFYAVIAQKEEAIKVLMNINTDILSKRDSMGIFPVNYSILMGNEEIVKLLLNKTDMLTKSCDLENRRIFQYAVASRNLNIVRNIYAVLYHNKSGEMLNMTDIYKRTALHYAAINKDKTILKYLLGLTNIKFNVEDNNRFRAIDYLLLDKIDNEMEDLIKKLMLKKDERTGDYVRNDLHTACQNRVDPETAIELVIEAKEKKMPELITSLLYTTKEITPLEIALNNDMISNATILKLIDKGKILKNKEQKDELLSLLINYQKIDLIKKLKLNKDYIEKNKDEPHNIYSKIKNKNSDSEIKEILNIDESVDCRNFSMYEYAIVKDRTDWYKEFISHESNTDVENIKKRVIEFNALKILKGLLKSNVDFCNASLWIKASKEAKEIILEHYKENKILKNMIIKAANELNIKMVYMGIRMNQERIKGLLHIAVEKRSIKLAKILIDFYHEDIFEEIKYGQTPYEMALYKRYTEMIIYFIMRGASSKKIESDSLTSYDIDINEKIKYSNELSSIINSKDLKHIESMVNKMKISDINRRDDLGNTLLFYALKENEKMLINKLLDKGACVNFKNKIGKTPLFFAIKYCKKKIVKSLINKGADVFCEYKGNSMLHYAMRRVTKEENKEKDVKKDSIAMILLKKGVIDLNPSTMNELVLYESDEGSKYITQLMYNMIVENVDNIKKLVNSKCINLEIKDSEGLTANSYAKNICNNEIINIIKEKDKTNIKMEKNERNFFGKTFSQNALLITVDALFSGLGVIFKRIDSEKSYCELIETLVYQKKLGVNEKTEEKIENDDNQELYEICKIEEGENNSYMIKKKKLYN